jgi:hypothetical protein
LSRVWTYIKAKIESVALSTLEVTGDLTVDTDTLFVDASIDRVTVKQDLYSQASQLTLNGFASFDGPSQQLQISTGTWDGATIAGNQTMSGQVELTGQSASTDDSAMTRSLGDARYGQTIYSVLSSDQTVTSSTTLVDSGIEIAIPVAGTYELETHCIYTTSGSAPGVREDTTLTGASITFQQGQRLNTENDNDSAATKAFVGNFANDLSVSVGADTHILRRRGIITTNGAGTFKVQFAQWVSDAANTVIKQGSFAKITKIN